jgi:hypothetical protein
MATQPSTEIRKTIAPLAVWFMTFLILALGGFTFRWSDDGPWTVLGPGLIAYAALLTLLVWDRPTAWGMLILWSLANGTAAALSAGLVRANAELAGVGEERLIFGVVYTLVMFVQPGLVLGLLQWLVLRRYVPHAAWWIPATAVGLGLGMVAASAIFGMSVGVVGEEATAGAVGSFAVCGLIAGVAQCPVLRTAVVQAGWWAPASALGHAAFLLLFLTLTRGFDVGTQGAVAAGGVSGVVSGMITGTALVWLLRRRRDPGWKMKFRTPHAAGGLSDLAAIARPSPCGTATS